MSKPRVEINGKPATLSNIKESLLRGMIESLSNKFRTFLTPAEMSQVTIGFTKDSSGKLMQEITAPDEILAKIQKNLK